MNTSTCPLCNCEKLTDSWLKLSFRGNQFDYLKCLKCHLLICNPMPDERLLNQMYVSSYSEIGEENGEDSSLRKFTQVLEFIKTLEKGTFIDHGCGDGKLLKAIQAMSWDMLGIEFNPDFADELKKDKIKIISHLEKLKYQADVLHPGDV